MLDFEMRQLEYFVTAASTGSYAQAAKLLFVSPQAISKGVQVLERRIGVALFERSPNGIALTSFGEVFFAKAEAIIQSMVKLQQIAAQYQREHTASLSVGIHSLCFKEHGGTIDWNDLLEFHENFAELTPSFLEMRGDSIIESIASGTLDFGISVPSSTDFDSFEGVVLKHFSMAALVSEGSSGFTPRDTVTIEELAEGQLVLFSEEQEFNAFFIGKARDENQLIEVSTLQIRTDSDIDFVLNRNLYVVRPLQHAKRTTKNARIRILPIINTNGEHIKMPLHIFWQKGRKLTITEEAFVGMIANLYAN